MKFCQFLVIFMKITFLTILSILVIFDHFATEFLYKPLFWDPPSGGGVDPLLDNSHFWRGQKWGPFLDPFLDPLFDHFLITFEQISDTFTAPSLCISWNRGHFSDPCKWSNSGSIFGPIFGPPGKSPKKWLFRFLLADLPKSHFFSTFFRFFDKIGDFHEIIAIRL